MGEKIIRFAGASAVQKQSVAPNATDPQSFAQFSYNTFYDVHRNALSGSSKGHLVSRPGFQKAVDSIAASANAQGVYWWSADHGSGFGNVYAVINGTLYKASGAYNPVSSFSSVGSLTGISTTAGCWFDEFFDGTNYLLLVKCEDGNLYTVTTAGSITRITDTDYTGLTAVGQIAVLDGFIFAVKADGTIANCDYRTPGTWTSTSTIKAEELMDLAKGLVRIGASIFCMGEFSIQRFTNAQNPVGSPLLRAGVYRVGCVSHKTIARYGDDVYFVGKTAEGAIGAYVLREGGIQKISTPDIDRLLGAGDEAMKAAILPMEGHVFYVINVQNSGGSVSYKSPAFDTAGFWHLWGTYDGAVGTSRDIGFFHNSEGNQAAYFTAQITASGVGSVLYLLAPTNAFSNSDSGTTDLVYYKTGAPTYLDGSSATITYGITTDDILLNNGDRAALEMAQILCRKSSSSIPLTLTVTSNVGTTTRTLNANTVPCRAWRFGVQERASYSVAWSNGYVAAEALRLRFIPGAI